MEIFARIFETEESQVLVYREYDPEEDVTIIHHICTLKDGITCNTKVNFTGDKQEEHGVKYLDEYTQEKAEKYITGVNKLLDSDDNNMCDEDCAGCSKEKEGMELKCDHIKEIE